MKNKEDIDVVTAEARLVSQAKSHFDESVDGLDAATLSRLNRGRHAALAAMSRGDRRGRWNPWLPLAGAAAAAVFAVVLWRGNPSLDEALTPPTAADFELLLNQDEFEMLQDLEFYSWIEIDKDSNGNVG